MAQKDGLGEAMFKELLDYRDFRSGQSFRISGAGLVQNCFLGEHPELDRGKEQDYSCP